MQHRPRDSARRNDRSLRRENASPSSAPCSARSADLRHEEQTLPKNSLWQPRPPPKTLANHLSHRTLRMRSCRSAWEPRWKCWSRSPKSPAVCAAPRSDLGRCASDQLRGVLSARGLSLLSLDSSECVSGAVLHNDVTTARVSQRPYLHKEHPPGYHKRSKGAT